MNYTRATTDKSIPFLVGTEFLIITVLLVVYGWATYERNIIWKDELSLWSDVAKNSPNKGRAYNEMGMYFYTRQRADRALPFFLKSIEIDPLSDTSHNNLGLCLLATGYINNAIEAFQEAIELNPMKGMYHINLGIAYLQKGLTDLAQREIDLGKKLKRKKADDQPLFHRGKF